MEQPDFLQSHSTLTMPPSASFDLQSVLARQNTLHMHLISSLADLSNAPSSLETQIVLLESLQSQIRECTNTLWRLEIVAKQTKEVYEDTRDSKVRKWIKGARLGEKGKEAKERWREKEEKEEREWLEAAKNETDERSQKAALLCLQAEALEEKERLAILVAEHKALTDKLEALYSDVFDGPTPGYPEEDEAEYAYLEAEKRHRDALDTYNTKTKAREYLDQACKRMSQCVGEVNDALRYSRWDTYGGGSTVEYLKRRALTDASNSVYHSKELVKKAQHMCPDIKPQFLLFDVQIASGSFFTDVILDDYWSNKNFHKKIKKSMVDVQQAFGELKLELAASDARKSVARSLLGSAKDELKTQKDALCAVRRSIFESVSSSVDDAEPPDYQATRPGEPAPPYITDGG